MSSFAKQIKMFELSRKAVFVPRGSRCNEIIDGCLATSTLKRSQKPFFAQLQYFYCLKKMLDICPCLHELQR